MEDTEIPMSAVFYSVYSGGSAVDDKETLSMGFNSTVASNSSGDMIIAWNTFDFLTLRTRIKASIVYGSEEESSSKALVELAVGADFPTTRFIDTGNYTFIRGMDVAVDTEGNFFIVWGGTKLTGTHIYLKAIYSNGVVLSNEVQVSQGFNKNYDPSIATDSQGNIIVTWSKFSLKGLFAGTRSVYSRRFDNNLQALGDEFKVNIVY
ncbi:MAG: hypothetical protein JRI49_03380 [Deltaproteobacteria bacterium]|nr:hypothetical protein [Deltaproteobacteria bacterium]